MQLLVIDVGTSSMRGILYDEAGHELMTKGIAYQVRVLSNGRVEQDPSDFKEALIAICCAVTEAGFKPEALAMTAQRSSIIPVDPAGEPLRPAIMWQDTRNAGIVDSLEPYRERIASVTGARLNTVFSGTKMTWIREHEPLIYEKTYKFCTIPDYLTFVMTGEFVTDETYGGRSLLMDLTTRKWSPEMLRLFRVDEEKLCRLIPPGSIAGRIQESFAAETGLKAGIPLISAGGDQQCGALGQGVYGPGTLEMTLGTGAYMIAGCEGMSDAWREGLVVSPHAVPGMCVLESSMLTCAALYNWLQRSLYQSADYETINQEIARVPAGANGVICLPYFQGRGTPDWNSSARGCFYNVDLGTTRADMGRAVLEAIAAELKNSLELMTRFAPKPERAALSGGLGEQPEMLQLVSDMLGLTVFRETGTDTTARGAWILGAVALGWYPTCAEAYQASAGGTVRTAQPDPEMGRLYEAKRQEINALYGAVSSLYK